MLLKSLIVLGSALFVACADIDFECTESGLYPRPKSDCKSYYVCSTENGIDYVASEQTCGDGLVFDGKQKSCVPQSAYACPDADPCQNQTGRFPIPNTNCASYYFCMKRGNGTVSAIYNCPVGSKFSPISHRCERAYVCPTSGDATTTTENTVTSDVTTTQPSEGTTSSGDTTIAPTSAPPDEATTATAATSDGTTITTSEPSEATTQGNSTPLTTQPPTESTIEPNSTTGITTTTPLPSSTTITVNSTTSWPTIEPTSSTPELTTATNNVTSTVAPPSGSNSTSPTNTTVPMPSEVITSSPSAPSNSTECQTNCIMCTKTGHYRIPEDTTSYVACVRSSDMLICGVNKCESGKVFCETSKRCIDRI